MDDQNNILSHSNRSDIEYLDEDSHKLNSNQHHHHQNHTNQNTRVRGGKAQNNQPVFNINIKESEDFQLDDADVQSLSGGDNNSRQNHKSKFYMRKSQEEYIKDILDYQKLYDVPTTTDRSSEVQNTGPIPLGRVLGDIRKQIKKSQSEETLLKNRIIKLRMEQQQNLRQINETQRQAEEVFLLRKQKEEEKQMKMMAQLTEIENQRAFTYELRQQQRDSIKQIKEEIKVKQKEEREQILTQRKAFQIEVENYQKQTLEQQKGIRDQVKLQQHLGRNHKAMENYQTQIEQEQKTRYLQESRIAELENKEMQIIKNLQHTQMLQKSAFEKLEQALTMRSDEYQSKYYKIDDNNQSRLSNNQLDRNQFSSSKFNFSRNMFLPERGSMPNMPSANEKSSLFQITNNSVNSPKLKTNNDISAYFNQDLSTTRSNPQLSEQNLMNVYQIKQTQKEYKKL